MDINLSGTNLTLTDEIRDYVEKHVSKIGKLEHDPSARLSIELERLTEHKTSDEFRAELMLHAPGLESRAESSSASLHSAIDEAIDKMQTESRKVKGKKKRMFPLEGLTFKNWLRGWRE